MLLKGRRRHQPQKLNRITTPPTNSYKLLHFEKSTTNSYNVLQKLGYEMTALISVGDIFIAWFVGLWFSKSFYNFSFYRKHGNHKDRKNSGN